MFAKNKCMISIGNDLGKFVAASSKRIDRCLMPIITKSS